MSTEHDVEEPGAGETAVDALSVEQAQAELERLAELLGAANLAYHTEDAPELSDAEYDRLKRRNAAIEARFPDLKLDESPSDQVGARPAEGFAKVTHAVRMMSLGNAFEDEDVTAFDTGIRKYLGLSADASLAFTSEPKIDGLSLSLRYEGGKLVQAATRGDGSVGENVTANARTISDIPAELQGAPEILEVRGEVYMSHADFAALNARQAEAGNKKIAVIAPAFSADCIETLEEINEEIKESFEHAGGEEFHYIPCLNDDDLHIKALSNVIEENLQGWID